MDVVEKARRIATENLRECYRKDGIVAGNHHFTDFWARDGFFAAFGGHEIGDSQVIKNMVELFFSYQRKDGLVPYRIMNGPVNIQKYLGKPSYYKKPKPTYRLRGFGQEILDGTILTVMWAGILGQNKYSQEILLGTKLLKSKENNGLLWDGPMAEWNDAVWKWGNLLYTNIIYWKMLGEIGKTEEQKRIGENMRKVLWNGKYFADWKDFQRQDYFYAFGNCLAIVWGLTTKKESELILEHCRQVKIDFSMETNYPKYPWWRVDLSHRIIGMGDYQNRGVLWWQPICAYIQALKLNGDEKLASAVIKEICQKIVYDKEIFECYERDGKPVKRWLYQAEHPFAWAAGMILWAIEDY